MLNFFKKNFSLLLLLTISLVSHSYLFFDSKILNYGDWVYYYNSQSDTVSNFILYLSSFNLGAIMPVPNNWIFFWIFHIVNNFNVTWDIFTRLFFLMPTIILTPIFSFLLFKKIFNIDSIAFFSACVYSYNTFFLKLQLDFLTYASLWWILPALFLSVTNYMESRSKKYLLLNALIVFFGIVYEIRIMLVISVFLFFFQAVYFIFSDGKVWEKLKVSLAVLVSFLLGVLGHLYWIAPMVLGGIGKDVMSSAAAGLFGSYHDIMDVFTLHMYSWSHNFALDPFIKQPIEPRHFLVPVLAVLGLISFGKLIKNKNKRVYFIFFSLTLLVFIFLGKQELEPFGKLYNWAFFNVPLFNLFRESSKFFILEALSMSFFFGIGLYSIYLFVKRYSKILSILIVSVLLFLSSIFNLQHFVDQSIGGMTKGVEISKGNQLLETKLSADNSYFRILWVPMKGRFGFYSANHPFLSMTDLVLLSKGKVNTALFDGNTSARDKLLLLLKRDYSKQLLDNMTVKYVIVPSAENRVKRININNTEDVVEIFEHFGSRQFFVNELSKISYLKKIDIGANGLDIYENVGYKPHIYQTGEPETIDKIIPYQEVNFSVVNPAEYKITLKGISGPVYLNFSESYHQNWKVRVGEFDWFKVLTETNYFVPDKNHSVTDSMLNSFYLDPASICKTYACKKNSDGSVDIKLTLYFRPQSYFYLGLIVSGIAGVLCVGFLLFSLARGFWTSPRFDRGKQNDK